jgi:tetratricopeptide (TPR) repeat protein
MINTGTADQQEAAQAVLYAIGGPRADTRLQILILQAELSATPARADDDRLRLHATLAANYKTLGAYRQALDHGQHELALRLRIQGPNHPQTLRTRNNIANWTGQCGNTAQALRLFTGLLPDVSRVLGPDHPHSLTNRSNIAYWTGQYGNTAQALRLFKKLLPDQVRVLGPDFPETLATRHNIAFSTGQRGDAAQALRLFKELLPTRNGSSGSTILTP